MTNKEKNPFEDADRLLLPLGSRMDEFEEFLLMSDKIFHITDFIDNPGEHGTDYMYYYDIDGNDIIVKCIFYQTYSREEEEKERTETTYIGVDKIFTKGIIGRDLGKKYDTYEEGKLTKDQEEFKKYLIHLSTPHLIEDNSGDRTPEAIAKIKSFLFYQTLGKEQAKELIENEIQKLGKDIREEDLAELNEIKENGFIKRSKNYIHLYSMKALRDMAKETGNTELESIEKLIKEMEEDDGNNP